MNTYATINIKFILASSLFAINVAKRGLTPQLLLTLYNSQVYPYLTYVLLLWRCAAKIHTKKISTQQKRAVRIIAGSTFTAHTEPLFQEFSILKLDELYDTFLIIIIICSSYIALFLAEASSKRFTYYYPWQTILGIYMYKQKRQLCPQALKRDIPVNSDFQLECTPSQ